MDQLTRCFSAWRVYRAGSREVLEGLVRPEHRAPSSELTQALEAWPHAHYWSDHHDELILIRPTGDARPESWLLHLGLFLLTVSCVLGAGAALAGYYPPPGGSGMLSAIQAGG
ncbi:MAG TPA: hypothetical protein VIU39_15935, partial [Anaerolineales bacterium]